MMVLKLSPRNKLNRAGFTLIEILIYIAIVIFIISSLLITIYQIINSYIALNQKVDLNEEMNFIMRKIAWALSGAGSINVASSTSISLNKDGYYKNPIGFNLASGNIAIQEGTDPATILNSSRIIVNYLSFQYLAASSTQPAGVKINLTASFNPALSQANTPSSSVETIIYLRH